ncbi:MAG: carboxymuconolactone decarboxylase family protein [Deltaproteobacteria bacterium]|nr:carboxymuconolactone decarboxylase family protein [Deltaproteobacteria bacterium]
MTHPHEQPAGNEESEQSLRSEEDARILAELARAQGHVPIPLPLVAKRPGTVATLIAHKNQIMEGGPLTQKERSLIALSSAVAVKSTECIRAHAAHARKAGATEDEVVQAVLIAGFVCGMSPIRAAYQGLPRE